MSINDIDVNWLMTRLDSLIKKGWIPQKEGDALRNRIEKVITQLSTISKKAPVSFKLYALEFKNASPTDIQKREQLKALYNQLPTDTAMQQTLKEKAREKFIEKFNSDPEKE
jgi:hypothetical protein